MFPTTGKRLEKFKKLVGKKIKTRRKELGYKSQEALAKALGTDQTRVAKWEAGRNLPDPKFQDLLQKILKVSNSFFDSFDGVVAPAGIKTAANMTVEEFAKAIVEAQTQKSKPESELASLIENLNDVEKDRLINILKNLKSQDLSLSDFPATKFEASSLRKLRAYKKPELFEELDQILETDADIILSRLGFGHLAKKSHVEREPFEPREKTPDKNKGSSAVSRKDRKSV